MTAQPEKTKDRYWQGFVAGCLFLPAVAAIGVLILALLAEWPPDLDGRVNCAGRFERANVGKFAVLQLNVGAFEYESILVRVTPEGNISSYIIDGDAPKYWSGLSSLSFDNTSQRLRFTSWLGQVFVLNLRTDALNGGASGPYDETDTLNSEPFGTWIREHLKTASDKPSTSSA